jgi:hypothetical protein
MLQQNTFINTYTLKWRIIFNFKTTIFVNAMPYLQVANSQMHRNTEAFAAK